MSSDDSDDEPLSVLAKSKQIVNGGLEIFPVNTKKKKPKKSSFKSKRQCGVTIQLQKVKESPPAVIERPADVWMYLKDLNPIGPYSCLLCSEWFINKTKVALHYIVNHKKSYCGICRYFMPSQEAGFAHEQYHTPWTCSQCDNIFETMRELRKHFSEDHHLVHCHLCYTRVPHGDEYSTHLFQKHSVTNVSRIDEDFFWIFDENNLKFKCLLCAKANNGLKTFANHYMAFHRMTLKCLAWLLSGKGFQFQIKGVDLTAHYVESELKPFRKFGYVDLETQPNYVNNIPANNLTNNTSNYETMETMSDVNYSTEHDIKIKHEITFEFGEDDNGNRNEGDGTNDNGFNDDYQDNDNDTINVKNEVPDELALEVMKSYKGVEDFDVTLMEMVIIQKCYSEYLSQTMKDINSNLMPTISDINYDNATADKLLNIDCSLCTEKITTINVFINHMVKMHSVKVVSTFSCRVCATVFDTASELELHVNEELGDFEDLWMCQFCDKEFDDRPKTRCHLTEHWNDIETDNCFSPHLGFKCKYCPTLYWNEVEREKHQVQTHFDCYREDFYKCAKCEEVFTDKVWLIHHFLQSHQNGKEPVPIYLLKCSLCCLVLPTVEDMRIHFNMTHPEAKKVYCSLGTCKHRMFSHKKSFQLHLKMYHVSPRRSTGGGGSCSVCGAVFTSGRSRAAHIAQAHRLSCSLCKRALSTLDERKIHYLLCHPGRHPFQCDECDKSFQYKSSLYLHKHDHAPNKQEFVCNFCDKTFKKRDSFREHVAIHSGPRHACSYCPAVFVQRSNMLRHERRHTGERPYACNQCNRTFADKGACTSHARTHQKEPSFSCMYCGQSFVQKSKLTYHIRKHTGENLETCSICSKMFTSGCALREHMKVHEKKPPEATAKCPLCGKWYKSEKYMMKHVRTTHAGVRFTCPICNKKVTSAVSLREHVLSHTNVKTFRCKICPKTYNVKRTMIRHLCRRHGCNPDGNLSLHYDRLDPRDCNLNLDEETITSIFGPRKRKVNDVLISDYVTVNVNNELNVNKQENVQESESDKESEKDSDRESEEEDMNVTVKQEPMEDDGAKVEPTDFVSVKIECVEHMDQDDTA